MNIKSDICPAWMVEIAYGYAKIADMASRDGNLGVQSEINAALAVEILLKSLSAEPVKNGKLGSLETNFRSVKMGHDFIRIYKTIPDEIKVKLNLRQHLCVLRRKNNLFAGKKYYYEDHAYPRGSDTMLLHTAGKMIPIIVNLFLENGSNDPWLMDYRREPGRFRLPTGISAVWCT